MLSSGERPEYNLTSPWHALDDYFPPLGEYKHSAEAFLQAWQDAHASIKRHLYRGEGYQHPHVIQGDLLTGATRAFWIDSLSAFYPGLLSLAGELDEGVAIHLLATAVWTRFSGLPERWNVATGNIESGLSWYGGRPEFVESTYYLYRATRDPWYLHVGEMVLRDLKRRCWTKCGWAGLQDVRSGELNDRMESFFLGETAKYMFLLYDPGHPLNNLDQPFVFSTEGHPLVIPKSPHTHRPGKTQFSNSTCQAAPLPPAFGISSTAARPDVFHAASLARLHLMPSRGDVEGAIFEYASDHPSVSISDLSSPTNYTFYPWTLPSGLVPFNGTSSLMTARPTLDLSFPTLPGTGLGPASVERVKDGIFIKTIGGMRFSMVQEGDEPDEDEFRVQVINNVPIGKDEKVYLSREITLDVLDPSDPNFTRVRDPTMIDIVIDVLPESLRPRNDTDDTESASDGRRVVRDSGGKIDNVDAPASMRTVFSSLVNHVSSFLSEEQGRSQSLRLSVPAIIPTGIGSGSIPDVEDASTVSSGLAPTRLPWSSIYFADDICDHRIPREVVRNHQILVIKRGGCSFSEKLRNIAAHPPSRSALKLVIVVSYESESPNPSSTPKSPSLAASRVEPFLVRPLLDELQTTAGGIPRRHLISMVMVGGGEETYELLRRATGVGMKRRYTVHSQGVPIRNLYIV